MKKHTPATYVAKAAIIAALYVTLTLVLAPISFKEIQVRISEALCILPVFINAAVPGLFIGCLLANLLGGALPMDIAIGSLATLLGAIMTYLLRKKVILAPLGPVLFNALLVPIVLIYAYGVPLPYYFMVLTVGAGEVLSAGILGLLLYQLIQRNAALKKLLTGDQNMDS